MREGHLRSEQPRACALFWYDIGLLLMQTCGKVLVVVGLLLPPPSLISCARDHNEPQCRIVGVCILSTLRSPPQPPRTFDHLAATFPHLCLPTKPQRPGADGKHSRMSTRKTRDNMIGAE